MDMMKFPGFNAAAIVAPGQRCSSDPASIYYYYVRADPNDPTSPIKGMNGSPDQPGAPTTSVKYICTICRAAISAHVRANSNLYTHFKKSKRPDHIAVIQALEVARGRAGAVSLGQTRRRLPKGMLAGGGSPNSPRAMNPSSMLVARHGGLIPSAMSPSLLELRKANLLKAAAATTHKPGSMDHFDYNRAPRVSNDNYPTVTSAWGRSLQQPISSASSSTRDVSSYLADLIASTNASTDTSLNFPKKGQHSYCAEELLTPPSKAMDRMILQQQQRQQQRQQFEDFASM